jgi:hypothetical protein
LRGDRQPPAARGLWQVASDRSFLDHVLSDAEWALVRTDDSDLAEDQVA